MSKDATELVRENDADAVVAYHHGRAVRRWQFDGHVRQLARRLPPYRFAINLCEDRYHFLVAFAACLSRQQTSLLPSSRARKEIERIGHIYDDSYVLTDNLNQQLALPEFHFELDSVVDAGPPLPAFDPDQIAVIVFTSGSTGMHQANAKRWRELVASAWLVQRRFGLATTEVQTIVATVPPQHMFGFEMSIVLPLVTGLRVSGTRPFFPLDVREALEAVPAPRILISTPIHLKACHAAGLEWPAVEFVISAAAPLPRELARAIEQDMQIEVREIYGCSEVGAIASRQTGREERWELLDGYRLLSHEDHVWLNLPWQGEPIILTDRIEIIGDKRFRLHGRGSDIINIAGKRGCLGDFNHKLKSIPGVEDGVFLLPDESDDKRVRLAALVVAPKLSEQEILRKLSEQLDEVFLPRPIRKVDRLPYTETGKLPRYKLLALLFQDKKYAKAVVGR